LERICAPRMLAAAALMNAFRREVVNRRPIS
jgi:hypothetical protein